MRLLSKKLFIYGIALFLVACGKGGSGSMIGNASGNNNNTTGGSCTLSPAPSYSAGVASVFNSRCVSCHSNFATYSGVAADATNIETRVADASMPPQSGGITSTERTEIVQWVSCGTLQ